MKIALINPNLAFQPNDPFTTGIVYMPIVLAYLGAALRSAGLNVAVIDAFGESPRQVTRHGEQALVGLTGEEVAARVPADARVAFVYAINTTSHASVAGIVRTLRQTHDRLAIVVLENTQSVTAYALRYVAEDLYRAGAHYILTGEPEVRGVELARCLLMGAPAERIREIDGVGSPDHYCPPRRNIEDLDALPLPAWDLFPHEQYWRLGFAHGPLESRRYLPLLTSRGCPYSCRFCVTPETNQRRWRSRSARSVVDEIEFWLQAYQVREFHIEDLDPTVSDERTREICREILRRGLEVTWKIAAGTKVETIRDEETVDLMAQAGCCYVSISPETGSPQVLEMMHKPFDLAHAVRLVQRMRQVGIFTQACFVLGFPGETDEHRKMTRDLVRELTRVGIDEIALFIITPLPGSGIYDELAGFSSLSQLSFTPTWRADYARLSRFRLQLYAWFLLWKLRYHPWRLLQQARNFLQRRFKTKMEMVPYRAWVLKRLR